MLKRWLVPLTLFTLTLASLGGGWWMWTHARPAHTFSGVLATPPQPAPDITLTDETQAPFSLHELSGKWILLTYGYTSCPDVCPMTLANFRAIKSALGDRAQNVGVVFVSVDPERDTPAVLLRYVKHFGADFKGLTGTPQAIAQAAKAYDVRYEIKKPASGAGYLVSHSAFVYLIDPQFRLRATYPFGVQPSEIASDLTYWMNYAAP